MRINLEEKITEHFIWREALHLASWQVCVFPETHEIRDNIIKTCLKLEEIRTILNTPLFITSFYRPKYYNINIGGSRGSFHLKGLAADFIPLNLPVPLAKEKILSEGVLERINVRMEDVSDLDVEDNWIHIDLGAPGVTGRYFKP
jgi:hypothetical protein